MPAIGKLNSGLQEAAQTVAETVISAAATQAFGPFGALVVPTIKLADSLASSVVSPASSADLQLVRDLEVDLAQSTVPTVAPAGRILRGAWETSSQVSLAA